MLNAESDNHCTLENLSSKDIIKKLLRISIPMMLGSTMQALYNLTDAFFLGKLGTAQIGAPSIAFSIVFFLTVFGMGMAGAGTTLVAQAKGAGSAAKTNHYMNQTASLLLVSSLILAALGAALSAPLLMFLSTPPDVYGHALVYLRIIFAGLPFTFIYFTLQSSFTAIGDSATPITVLFISQCINVALDPLLIFGRGPFPRMETAGAALATVISQAVCAFCSLIVLRKGKAGLKLSLKEMRPNPRSWQLLAKIGLPSSLGQGISAFGFTVLQGAVNMFGTATIAAFGVGNRLMNMFNIPAQGLAGAVTTLVGNSMGAKNEKLAMRSVRLGLLSVIVIEVPLLLLAFFYGGGLVHFFVDDPESIRLGALMFKIVCPSLLMFALYMALSGAFQGAGDTKIIMVLAIVRLWVIRVPLAYIFAYTTNLGALTIWIAMFVSNFLTAAAGFIYFKIGRWKKAVNPDSI